MFFKIKKFEEVDSTNTYLLENNNLSNFIFVFAKNQLNGHGRESKIWENEKGKDILFSFLIKNKKLISQNKMLSMYCAYLISKFLETKLKVKNVSIKWPNDVFVNDKKICGILLESKTKTEKMNFIVIGIGLNCNSEFISEQNFKYPPTSLKNELKKELNINKVMIRLTRFIYLNFLFRSYRRKKFFEYLNSHNFLLNKKVSFNENEIGIAKQINQNFSLKIEKINSLEKVDIESSEINLL